MSYIGSPAAPTIATVSDDTITSAKIADGAVTPSDLSTGHPNWDSSGNFLHQTTSNTISGTSINKMTLGDGTGQYGIIQNVGTGSGYYGFANNGTYKARMQYDLANEALTFQTNATERMRIDSSGNVGIGTSTTGTYALSVDSQSSGVSNSEAGIYSKGTRSGVVYNLVSNNTYTSTNTGTGIKFSSGDFDTGAILVRADGTASSGDAAGYMTFHTSNNASEDLAERMRIDSSGNMLVGKTTTSTTTNGVFLSAANGTNFVFPSNHYVIFNRNASGAATLLDFRSLNVNKGSISFNGTGISYNTSSDYRLKENVVEVTDGIDRVKLLKPSRFNFITDPDKTVDGFLAHEVSDIVPEAITGTKDAMRTEEYEVTPAVLDDDGNVVTEAVMGTREVPDYQGIDQSKLVPLLTAALQEAITKIESLEARVATLESA